jgi:hypothetical protein
MGAASARSEHRESEDVGMIVSAGLLASALILQVPPPDAARKQGDDLRQRRQVILDREAADLSALAVKLASGGEADAAAEVRRHLPPPPQPDGPTRFVPLPDVVPARTIGLPNVPPRDRPGQPRSWTEDVDAARGAAAAGLFELAMTAARATPRELALADACLRDVIARRPDHPEARRLLGFVPYEGGWATPYAVDQFRKGMVPHPTYGWVKATWVPHLERGELPSKKQARGKEIWLSADEADAERADYQLGWRISTEYFLVQSNAPLKEAIAFVRHLEMLHEVFESLFADVIGDSLPLARRFKSQPGPARRLHLVSYFAERQQYIEYLRQIEGERVQFSLGLYLPRYKTRPGHAYFFRDPNRDLPETANLYHEVSHELLFESGVAGPREFEKNVGNYWVFEGLGAYFETLTVEPDGSVAIGGRVGPRLAKAKEDLVLRGRLIPLSAFVSYNKPVFNSPDDDTVRLHYEQAMALATFLMQGRGGAYREGFLDYVRDACQGKIRRASGQSLEQRVGVPYATLESEMLDWLKGMGSEKPAEAAPPGPGRQG